MSNFFKNNEEINKFYKKKENLKNDIKDLINKFQDLIISIDKYFDIYENIINRINDKYNRLNYLLIQNINELNKFKDSFINDINKIIHEENINNKVNNILDLYNKMNISNNISNNIYYKEDNFNVIKYDKDNIDYPEFEDLTQASTNTGETNSDNSIINKTIEYNNDYKISEGRKDNNYKDFDISKIKKLLTLKNDKLSFSKVYILNDGRIIAHNDKQKKDNNFLCYVFDLKNDICFNLNFKKIKGIFEMDDGMIIIAVPDKLVLINLKIKDYEIIQKVKVELFYVHKLTNDKILTIDKNIRNIYVYKNKNLSFKENIKLKSLKNLKFFQFFTINEDEMAIYYGKLVQSETKHILGFCNLKKDSIVKTFEFAQLIVNCFDILNNNILIAGSGKNIIIIEIKSHYKKKEYTLKGAQNIDSIVCLNENQFIVRQNKLIHHFQLGKDFKLNIVKKVELKYADIYKYPKCRLLIKTVENDFKTLYIYG